MILLFFTKESALNEMVQRWFNVFTKELFQKVILTYLMCIHIAHTHTGCPVFFLHGSTKMKRIHGVSQDVASQGFLYKWELLGNMHILHRLKLFCCDRSMGCMQLFLFCRVLSATRPRQMQPHPPLRRETSGWAEVCDFIRSNQRAHAHSMS